MLIFMKNIGISYYLLQHLEVINCSLLTVPSQWFSNLTSLEELDLSQNGIMFLDKGWLSGLRSLKNLNLARNKVV